MSTFSDVNREVKNLNLHKDEKSLEKDTGIITRKHKLVGESIAGLDQFHFFILYSDRSACKRKYTIRITRRTWKNNSPDFSKYIYTSSYVDITKVEVMTSAEVKKKIDDTGNGFKYLARLPASRFKEMKNKFEQCRRDNERIPSGLKTVMSRALGLSVKRVISGFDI